MFFKSVGWYKGFKGGNEHKIEKISMVDQINCSIKRAQLNCNIYCRFCLLKCLGECTMASVLGDVIVAFIAFLLLSCWLVACFSNISIIHCVLQNQTWI